MNKYWFILLLVLPYCSPKKESVENTSIDSNKVVQVPLTSKDSIRFNFEGIWAENETDDAFFIIERDSIFSIDREGFYYYVNDNEMIIDYKDFIGRHTIVKVSPDSLILINEDSSITKLYRR